jgi:hypothetical protein
MFVKKGGPEPTGGKLFAQGLEPASLKIVTDPIKGIF